MICGCGDEITEPKAAIVAAGGWCAPKELAHDYPDPPMCSDCKSRMLTIMLIGIDPGKNCENLRVP